MKKLLFLLTALILGACSQKADYNDFVRVVDGRFLRGGKPVRFVGANFWYGAVLASEGRGGDRERLAEELDTLKALGISNLRVLVGAEGSEGVPYRISPSLQTAPGEYNDTLLRGLDYLLCALAERDMQAVLYLNNCWEWSGGFGAYLEWSGEGRALLPLKDGYIPYTKEMSKFSTAPKAKELFFNHIRTIVGRINSISGKPYAEDPAIFAWEICNEPRCFSSDSLVREAFAGWIAEAAGTIREKDKNHLITTGSEGYNGCEQDWGLFEQVHSCPNIDYITVHIWPYNWAWTKAPSPENYVAAAIDSTKAYLYPHLAIAERLGKPVVVEEFGFPRDSMLNGGGTSGRDAYYRFMMETLINQVDKEGPLAGVNFWGWSGSAPEMPQGTMWAPGLPYCADPAQEEQGLNGVYLSDEGTVSLLEKCASELLNKK